MKPEEPEYLKQWREIRMITNTPPKCCHTCTRYSSNGYCTHVNDFVPVEFANHGSGKCPDYSSEPPF